MTGGGERGEARTACAVTAADVVAVIGAQRCDLASEAATQANLESAFVAAFGADQVSREHRLGPADRPDFLLGGAIVVEAKGKRHRAPAVLRQLRRYAAYPEVSAIVLATARAMNLPTQLSADGRRWVLLRTVNLGRAWL